eukprot:13464113-Ditylum_brightwellii.AAC.1
MPCHTSIVNGQWTTGSGPSRYMTRWCNLDSTPLALWRSRDMCHPFETWEDKETHTSSAKGDS